MTTLTTTPWAAQAPLVLDQFVVGDWITATVQVRTRATSRVLRREVRRTGEVVQRLAGPHGEILYLVIVTGRSANRSRYWIGRVGLVAIERAAPR